MKSHTYLNDLRLASLYSYLIRTGREEAVECQF